MNEKSNTDFLMSMSFSLFGMLLIFGLGFVFPDINPYVVVKWIVIVAAVVFVYSVLAHKLRWFISWRMSRKSRSTRTVAVSKPARKTTKK